MEHLWGFLFAVIVGTTVGVFFITRGQKKINKEFMKEAEKIVHFFNMKYKLKHQDKK